MAALDNGAPTRCLKSRCITYLPSPLGGSRCVCELNGSGISSKNRALGYIKLLLLTTK